jgi:predicted nucleotidyltransferase
MKMNNKEVILNRLFENSYKEYHIRELARDTNISPNTVITITDELKKENLIFKKKDETTNMIIIKANTDNDLFLVKKKNYNAEKIIKSGLVEYLNESLSYPLIILFGSYSKGENHNKSDMDIFILADEKEKIDLKPFETKLNCKIELFLYSKKEYLSLKKSNPELLNNILNGYKLSGVIEVF